MYTPEEDLVVAFVTKKLKEKYGTDIDLEKELSEEDSKELSDMMATMSEDDWKNFEQDMNTEKIESAQKGRKLDYIKKLSSTKPNTVKTSDSFVAIAYKKGGKTPKKCKCGCNMVITKEAGGKLVEKCACGCKQKADGGVVKTYLAMAAHKKPLKCGAKLKAKKK